MVVAPVSLWRRAAKRDEVEPAIVAALEKAGVRVWRLSRPFDLLAHRAGVWHVLEVKGDKGKLTEAQQRDLAGNLPVHVVRTPDEALRAVGAVR